MVSAIGHEQDSPLLDYVADVRASTPTDAAKRVVPDVAEQLALVDSFAAARGAAGRLTSTGSGPGWRPLASRPALADPVRELERLEER